MQNPKYINVFGYKGKYIKYPICLKDMNPPTGAAEAEHKCADKCAVVLKPPSWRHQGLIGLN